MISLALGPGVAGAVSPKAACTARPDYFESARLKHWADWLAQVESRAALHRTYEKRLSELKAQHRVLQLEASSNRASDAGDFGGDYARRVYENVLAQAKLLIERKQALEQPLETPVEEASEGSTSFLVHSFLR